MFDQFLTANAQIVALLICLLSMLMLSPSEADAQNIQVRNASGTALGATQELSGMFEAGQPITVGYSLHNPQGGSQLRVNSITAANTVNLSNASVSFDFRQTRFLSRFSFSNFSVTFTPLAAGPFSYDLTLPHNAGNAANPLVIRVSGTATGDTTRPTVSLSNPPAAVNAAFNVTATFSESVTGFIASDVMVENATVAVTGSGATYTLAVTPTTEGEITLSIPENVAQDAAGNMNTATASTNNLRVTYDTTAPAVMLTGPARTNDSAFDVTATFNEDVTGFGAQAADVTVENASVTVTAVSGTEYTLRVTPDGMGNVSLTIPTNAAVDVTGNGNTASSPVTVIYDVNVPTVGITAPPLTNDDAFEVTAEFSETVTGFVMGDTTVTNGAVTGFSGSGTTYTFTVIPDGMGDITIQIPANAAQDGDGNGNPLSDMVTVDYDGTAPTVTLTAAPVTRNSPFGMTAEFSEPVTGFVASDVTAMNATVAVTAVSDTTYTLVLTPNGDGVVTVMIPADAAIDAAGNGNTESSAASTTYDATAPTFTLTAPEAVNSTAPFDVTMAVSEDVTFNTLLVGASNASENVLGGRPAIGSNFTIRVTPDGSGDVRVSVGVQALSDAAGNLSARVETTVRYDATGPTVTFSGAPDAVNSTTAFDVTATFSEDVTGFEAGDVTATNASVTVSGSGATYTLSVTPDGSGNDITLSIAANRLADAAGNMNAASDTVSVAYDTTAPTVSFTGGPAASVNTTDAFDVTATFNEPVTGFEASDVTVENATVALTPVSGTNSYTLTVTPTGAGNIAVMIPAGVVMDTAGNGSQASNTIRITYDGPPPDTTPPTVILSGAPDGVNSDTAFNVTATFSEDVTGFETGDVTAQNASVTVTAVSAMTYTLTVTPDGQGDISLSIAADVAEDAASNGNTVSDTVSVSYSALSAPAPEIAIFDGGFVEILDGGTDDLSGTFEAGVQQTVIYQISNFGDDDLNLTDLVVSNEVNIIAGTVNLAAPSFTVPAASGFEFQVTFTPASAGAFSFDLAIANNDLDENPFDITMNGTATPPPPDAQPVVGLSGAPDSVTSTAAFDVTATFSEGVTGFEPGDVVATNASVTIFGSGATYTLTVTPDGMGDISLSIPANVAGDSDGNANTASNAVSVRYTPPEISVSRDGLVLADGAADGQGDAAIADVEQQITYTVSNEGTSPLEVTGVTTDNGFNLTGAVTLSTTSFTVQPGASQSVDVTFTPARVGEFSFDLDISNNDADENPFDITVNGAASPPPPDTTQPTVVLGNAPDSVSTTDAFDVTVTFSEDVSGFEASDVVATNAAVTISGSDADYTLTVTPDGMGDISLRVPADVVGDSASNANTGSNTVSVRYTPPEIVVSRESNTIANGGTDEVGGNVPAGEERTLTYTVENNGDVPLVLSGSAVVSISENLDSDLSIGAYGTNTIQAGGSTTFAVTYTPSAGDFRIGLNIVDASGSAIHSVTIRGTAPDTTLPTVLLSAAPASVTTTDPFDVTATFSEAVTGFDASDITPTNATVTVTDVSAAEYTLTVTPDGQGNISLSIPAGAAQDAAGNGNTASDTVSVGYSAPAPEIAIFDNQLIEILDGGTDDLSGTFEAGVPQTVTYQVSNLGDVDLNLTGLVVSNEVNIIADTVNVTVPSSTVPAASGFDIIVTFTPASAGAFSFDLAIANNDADEDPYDITVQGTATPDTTAPTVALSGVPQTVSSTAPFDVTATFSEDVTGFTAVDVTVTGATVAIAGSGPVYTLTVTPDGSDDITVSIRENAVQDGAGNMNDAAEVSVTYNATPEPEIAIFKGGFAEILDGGTDDLSGTFEAGVPQTVTYQVSNLGDVDLNLTGLVVSNEVNIIADTVNLSVPSSTVPAASGFDIIVTFTPASAGAFSFDLAIANNDADEDPYDITVQGTATPDATAPTVALSGAPDAVNSTALFDVTATFSEDVTGFAVEDVTVQNASVTVAAVSGTTYTLTVTPDGLGDISLSIPADRAEDSASNGNAASSEVSVRYNAAAAPEIAIFKGGFAEILDGGTDDLSGTFEAGVPQTVTYQVSNLGDVDLNLTGLVVSNEVNIIADTVNLSVPSSTVPAASGFDIIVTFTPASAGAFSFDLAIANNDADEDPYDITVQGTATPDATAPTVALSGAPDAVNSTAPFDVTATFSEAVTEFAAEDVTVMGASVAISGDGPVYTLTVTPNGSGDDITLSIAAGSVEDAAGNMNTVSNSVSVTYDTTVPADAPEISVSRNGGTISDGGSDDLPLTEGSAAGVTYTIENTGTAPLIVQLPTAENLTNVTVDLITIGNGSGPQTVARGESVDATVFVTPGDAGPFSFDLNIESNDGDESPYDITVSGTVSGPSDTTPPTVSLSDVPDTVNSTDPFDVTAEFSEDVTGFEASDVSVTNASVTVTSVSATNYTLTVTPDGNGDISFTIPAGAAQDSSGNDNSASNEVSITYNETLEIAVSRDNSVIADGGSDDLGDNIPAGAPRRLTYTVSNGGTAPFEVTDVTAISLGNLTGSVGVSATSFTVAPGGSETIDVTFTPQNAGAFMFDLEISVNDADVIEYSFEVIGTAIFDTTLPTVELTGAPDVVTPTEVFTVTATFSEAVTGFETGDVSATNASVAVSGSGADYTLSVTPTGSGHINLSIPADVAVDSAGNGNMASNQERVVVRAEDPILRPIGSYLETRARALLTNQPELIRFLQQGGSVSGEDVTRFNLNATNGSLSLDGGFVRNGVWGEITGSHIRSDAGNTNYVFGAFGAHRQFSEHLLAGVMLQFDISDSNLSGNSGSIDGEGWLVGPYFAARHKSQPLYFEGRLLYGQSDNDIGFEGREGSFDTTRWLAQLRMEGEVVLGDGGGDDPRLIPYADASWTQDRAEGFTDSLGIAVRGQKVSLGQLELGSNIEVPLPVKQGNLMFTGGLAAVWSHTDGDFVNNRSQGRGRAELGLSYQLNDTVQVEFDSYYDGIGVSNFEGYGLSLSAEINF